MIQNSKTVLITGATKGIGFATSRLLVKEGFQVVGIARNPLERFPGHLYLCDLAVEEEVQTTLAQIAKAHHIDHIVNNAGVALPQSLGEVDLATLKKVLSINLLAAVQITQFFLAGMKQQQNGRIVNIVSRAVQGAKARTSYSAAKSGLVGCTKTWALELAESNITVNAIAPGPIETDLFRKTRPKGSKEEAEALSGIPMGRLGKPEEVASLIRFLLSEDAGYITGQVIFIDGGKSI